MNPSTGIGRPAPEGATAPPTGAGPGLRADLAVERRGFSLRLPLRIEPGTTAALLGPNGAGKSTTVEVLAGLLPLDGGRIELDGRILDDPDRGIFVPPDRRNIGIVFQDYLLFDHLSVLDNISFGPTARRAGSFPPSARRSRRQRAEATAHRWIEALDLGGLEHRRPSELSGGQAQRVAMARALAAAPDLLLLDEPLAALDISTRNELRRAMVDHLALFDGPRLLITHEPAEAFLLADELYVVEAGHLVQRGTPEEIRRRPSTPYVAALTGTNFLTGFNRDGAITIDRANGADRDGVVATGFVLTTSDTRTGPVRAGIDPRAVSLHARRPEGSPRNTWQTEIDWLEPLGETTRIRLGPPLPLLVDITPAAAEALHLAPGLPIWAAVKATEVTVHPA